MKCHSYNTIFETIANKTRLRILELLQEKDLSDGFGEVYLPGALDRKYPAACKEWGWQYVFPSARLSVDPRSKKTRRHHISDGAIQNAMKKAVRAADIVKPASVHTLRHNADIRIMPTWHFACGALLTLVQLKSA
jgi:integrase